ncbi:MAG: LysR family transcriptional regulator, partial [Pseudomonadaceae bacterium]
RFPQTSVSVYLAPPKELPLLVKNQAVDVAYGLMPAPENEGYQWFRWLADVRMMTVVGPEHALNQLPQVLQDDLMDHTQVTLAYMDNGQLVAEAVETDNFLAFTQYELMCDAVLSGVGWADLPFPLIADDLRQGRLKLVRHRSAQWWKIYAALESERIQGGAVVSWLGTQLEAYLADLA